VTPSSSTSVPLHSVVEGERDDDSIDIHSLMIDAMNDTDETVRILLSYVKSFS